MTETTHPSRLANQWLRGVRMNTRQCPRRFGLQAIFATAIRVGDHPEGT